MSLLECTAAEAIWIGSDVRATVVGHAEGRILFMVTAPRGLALTGADSLVFSNAYGADRTDHTFWMHRGGRFGIGPAEVRVDLDPGADATDTHARRFVLHVVAPAEVAVERDGARRDATRPLPLAG